GWILGCAGVALLCWLAVGGTWRRLALVGLGLSLAAAVCSHYFAVLLLLPLALGESVRAWRLRKLDAGVWLALLAPLLPLACWLPFGWAARDMTAGFWAKPTLRGVLSCWATLPRWAWVFVPWPLVALLLSL